MSGCAHQFLGRVAFAIAAAISLSTLPAPASAEVAASRNAAKNKSTNIEVARWRAQAQHVTILRDKWGIPHIYAKTDADVVFGMLYAQAEDDFNRIEVNYLNALGRLAEVEGEKALYSDLRM